MLKTITETITNYLGKKHRPCFFWIVYLLCGAIELLCILTCVLPFRIALPFMNFVSFNGDINVICVCSLYSWVILLLTDFITMIFCKNLVIRNNSIIYRIKAVILTANDLANIITSVLSLVFMISVFIRFYKTQTVFLSYCARFVYIFVALKCMRFILYSVHTANLKLLDRLIIENEKLKSNK